MTTVESPNGHIGDWNLSVVESCPLRRLLKYALHVWQIHSVQGGLCVIEGYPLLGVSVLGDSTVLL